MKIGRWIAHLPDPRHWPLRRWLSVLTGLIAGGTVLLLGLLLLTLLDGSLQRQLGDYLRDQAQPVVQRELGPPPTPPRKPAAPRPSQKPGRPAAPSPGWVTPCARAPGGAPGGPWPPRRPPPETPPREGHPKSRAGLTPRPRRRRSPTSRPAAACATSPPP